MLLPPEIAAICPVCLAEYQLYRYGFYYACLVYSIAVALSLGVGTLAEKIYH
jgi:hypothetical protein